MALTSMGMYIQYWYIGKFILRYIGSLYFLHTVATLEEEKKAAQVEREALLANYQQHLQIEKEQLERKKKVRF